jgi:hypothetical protein
MGPVKMTTQLGPTSAKDISPEVERFVNSLPAEDRDKLKKAEGKWPDYPQALHEAAKKNKLAIPELDLPGDPQMWERIRKTQPARMPEPPEFLLRQFALELNKSGDGPRLSLADPHDRQIIIKKFLDKHPEWRRQLEQQDRGKMERKGPRP